VNTFYHLNKTIGIVFGVALILVGAYKLFALRDELAHEAGRRLQHRLEQISEETAAQLQSQSPKWPDVQLPPNWQQNFEGNALSPDGHGN